MFLMAASFPYEWPISMERDCEVVGILAHRRGQRANISYLTAQDTRKLFSRLEVVKIYDIWNRPVRDSRCQEALTALLSS